MGGRMKFNITCPRCNGTGHISNDCPTCHGEGTVTRTETVEFRIKPGTRDGQRIRLQGKGNAGINGGPAGDLFLIVRTGTQSGLHARRATTFRSPSRSPWPKPRSAPRSKCPPSTAARS